MNCREFTEFLNDYFDGDLADAERDVFDAHLAECPDCRAYLETYRYTVRLSRVALTGPAPADLPEDLIAAILAARATHD